MGGLGGELSRGRRRTTAQCLRPRQQLQQPVVGRRDAQCKHSNDCCGAVCTELTATSGQLGSVSINCVDYTAKTTNGSTSPYQEVKLMNKCTYLIDSCKVSLFAKRSTDSNRQRIPMTDKENTRSFTHFHSTYHSFHSFILKVSLFAD